MTPTQIGAVLLSLLAVGAGAVGAAAVSDEVSTGPPPWANDDHEGAINVSVAGNVTPGETVTLTATLHGEPVPHAPVSVNGETVGETAADGTIELIVPADTEEFEVEIEPDYEGEFEQSLEDEAEDDETEVGEEDDDDERRIDLDVDGNVTPNETVTVTATVNGTPLANADVTVNGEDVGTTDANGTIEVTVPENADEFEVEAEYEHEGSFEIVFESDDEDDERDLDVAVDGDVAAGNTVTVMVTEGGDPVENATVTVNDETVGTTDEDGQLDVTIPEEADEIEIEVTTHDGGEGEWEHEFEDGEDEDEDSDDEEADDEDEDDDG